MPDNQVPKQDNPSPAESTLPRKFAGKYESVEALEKGYLESARETQRILADARIADERARAAEAVLSSIRGPQPDPISEARARYASGEATPEDLDVLVTSKAQEIVHQTMRPLIVAANAQAAIPAELLPEAQALLAQDANLTAKYHRIAAGDPEAAGEWISDKVRTRRAEAGMHQEDAATKAAREAARRDAGIITGGNSTGAGNSDTSAKEREEKLAALAKKTRVSRDDQAFAKELFSGIQMWEPGQAVPRTLD